MLFGLSEEQQLLKNSAREFFQAECPSAEVRRLMETDTAFDAALWSKMAEQGWTGLPFSESDGGMGLGFVRLVRGPGRVRWMLAVIFPVVYYTMLTTQKIVFARYLLPLTPSVCLLAATGVVSGVSLLRRYEIPRAPRTALIAALTIAALLPPALTSIGSDRGMARSSTVDQAYSWILQNIPAGASIVLERRAILLPAQYRASYVGQLRRKTYEELRKEGVDYVVANSESYGTALAAPQKYPDDYNDYMRIFSQSRELQTIAPSPEQPGPELRIFKVVP